MVTLQCLPIEKEDNTGDFDCGNASINDMLQQSYYPHILKQVHAYKVLIEGTIVGFYEVSIRSIDVTDSDANFAEKYYHEPTYCCVFIDFIAVDQNLQGSGIGTVILKSIIDQAHSLYAKWPVRLVILDALREKIQWYTNRGFYALNSAELHSDSETMLMFFDLMPAQDVANAEEYCSSFY